MNPTEYEFIIPEPEEAPNAASPAQSAPGSNVDEESLKARALLLWNKEERCVHKFAPILYELRTKLNAQGKKGKGFRAWLIAHSKNPSTAYRWIREYAEKNGLELPYAHTAKKKPTSSHVEQSTDVASSETTPMNISNPAWHISQMNASEQVALLGIGSFAEVLKKAKELVETPSKEFQSASQSFNPETQEVAVYGAPNYHWSPQENTAEIARAQAYMVALQTALKALNYEAKRMRSLVNTLQEYTKKLNDNNQPPFFQAVQAKATIEKPLGQKTA